MRAGLAAGRAGQADFPAGVVKIPAGTAVRRAGKIGRPAGVAVGRAGGAKVIRRGFAGSGDKTSA